MTIRSRDRQRAEANARMTAGLRSVAAYKPGKTGEVKRTQPTAQQLAFRDYVASGMTAEQAREAVGLPQLS